MNSNILILRRYAIKPTSIKQKILNFIDKKVPHVSLNIPNYGPEHGPVDKSIGLPIHRVIDNAMIAAENELGLSPDDDHKSLSYRELQNPNSNFTKTFNAYKKQIGEVPDPQQHMKHVFIPMLKHFAKYGEAGLTPRTLDESHNSKPIDLLTPEKNPFDFTVKEGPGLGYRPNIGTPSGFVQVPDKGPFDLEQPTKRVIKNPALHPKQRGEVYQTIAHALANREDVHQALQQKHGFDQATAQKHYNNFLKNKNKPQGTIRPENQTPLPRKGGTGPGGIRRRKFERIDLTDLMAIPVKKKYMRIGDPQTHDAIMKGIVKNNDESGLGPFADFLQEHGAPGAELVREAHRNTQGERVSPPFQYNHWWPGDDYRLPGQDYYREDGSVSNNGEPVAEGEIEIRPSISRPYDVGKYRTGSFSVIHGAQNKQRYNVTPPYRILDYHIPVESRKHLQELTHDLPEPMRNRLWEVMAPYLRETHEQESPTEEPVQLSAYRAPKGGSIVRGSQYAGGEMVPSMTGKFMNPRRNSIKNK